MISIRKSVSELDQKEERIERSIRCYSEAVGGIRAHAFEACPPIAPIFRHRLEQIEEKLNPRQLSRAADGVQQLERFSAELVATLEEYSQKSVEIFRQDTANLRDILAILGASAEALNSNNLVSADQFQDFGKQLEELTQIADLTVLRQSLSNRVVEFREKIDVLRAESNATIARLKKDVSMFRQKLDEAEMQAATDPLTGLWNRRELQRQIDMRIEVEKGFSLLMFDLNEFKGINDRFGHAAGDQVLRHFAKLLKETVRATDVVARWGGDEFIILFDANLEEAIGRAKQIFTKLEPPMPLQLPERKVMLAIRASSGVAEHRRNELAQELFARVDALLYANKPAARLPSAV